VGLVWRAANEDQLAFILSREMAHYSEHHALGALRAQRRGHEALLVVDTAAATLGAFFASDIIDLAFGGVVRTLAQNRERQADHLGIERLEAAGDDGAEAVAFSNAIAGEARAGRQRAPSAHQPQDLARATPTSRGRIAALRPQATAPDASVDTNAY